MMVPGCYSSVLSSAVAWAPEVRLSVIQVLMSSGNSSLNSGEWLHWTWFWFPRLVGC